MLLRTHLVFAVLFYLVSFQFLQNRVVFLIFLLLATIFVDIDSRKSKLGKRWYLRPLQWFVSHRGVFHTLFAGLFFSFIIYSFNNWAGWGFFAGYCIHLILDCLTDRGCRLFWPVSDIKISFFVRSGGIIEEILFVLVLLTDCGLIWKIFSGYL